jgi:hypothetical protein
MVKTKGKQDPFKDKLQLIVKEGEMLAYTLLTTYIDTNLLPVFLLLLIRFLLLICFVVLSTLESRAAQ